MKACVGLGLIARIGEFPPLSVDEWSTSPIAANAKNKIDSLLRQGIISPITFPTERCSGNVPVPKPTERVRICVDLTSLNKAVQCETHSMSRPNTYMHTLFYLVSYTLYIDITPTKFTNISGDHARHLGELDGVICRMDSISYP